MSVVYKKFRCTITKILSISILEIKYSTQKIEYLNENAK